MVRVIDLTFEVQLLCNLKNRKIRMIRSIINILLLSTMGFDFLISMEISPEEIQMGKEIIKKAIAIGIESYKMENNLNKISL